MSERPFAIVQMDPETSPERVEQVRRDLLDGAALRRLREAVEQMDDPMPWFRVEWDPTDVPGIPWSVHIGGADESAGDPKCGGSGPTIAEAADKAREALG